MSILRMFVIEYRRVRFLQALDDAEKAIYYQGHFGMGLSKRIFNQLMSAYLAYNTRLFEFGRQRETLYYLDRLDSVIRKYHQYEKEP